MNLSNCWTSHATEKHLHQIHKISLRSVLKTGGLFDIGFTGNELGVASGKTDPSDVVNWDLGYSAIFDSIGLASDVDSAELIGDVTGMLDEVALQLDKEPDFMDRYVDLSTFLSEDTLETQSEVSNSTVTDTDLSATCIDRSSLKRKLDTVNVASLKLIHTVDHDYVSKKVRVSALTEIDDVTEVASSSNIKSSPEEKYRYRRDKNNVASKRSREIRKMKFAEMEEEVTRLEKSNNVLKEKMEVLEKLAKEMKASLIEKLSCASH